MEIDLLYVPECPNRIAARGHLDRALALTRVVAVVREQEPVSPSRPWSVSRRQRGSWRFSRSLPAENCAVLAACRRIPPQ